MRQQQNNLGPKVTPGFAFVALVLGNIAIAFGPLLVRWSDTGPIASGFWRVTLALPVLFLLGRRAGYRWKSADRHMVTLAIWAGIFFGIDIAVWHLGIFQTKMANATLFANSASLLLIIYGVILARAWPSKWQNVAILLAFAGGGLLLGQSFELSPRNFIGDLLCLLGGLFYTFYLVLMIRVRQSTESWTALGIASASGAVVMLIGALAMGETIMPQIWWPLLLLAFSSQIFGQGCLTIALPHLPPLVIGLALLLQPAISATAAWVVFDESLTILDLIGGFMVMAALVLVRIADRGQKPLAVADNPAILRE
jgi:drug/metabolite transporter (DMT)-like permease